MAKRVTDAQFSMLLDADLSLDNTVAASGFNNGKHSPATGRVLTRLGLLDEIPAHHVPHLYRVTPRGRRVVRAWGELVD
jgi:hypothetical protein